MARRTKRAAQMELPRTNTWGGKRPGAGRKRRKGLRNVMHRRRTGVKSRFPMHVTWRIARGLESMRRRKLFRAIENAFWTATGRFGLRLIDFSVQTNHIHLIVEAPDQTALTRALKGLGVRIAHRVNRVLDRAG